jgi:hypothetical protein
MVVELACWRQVGYMHEPAASVGNLNQPAGPDLENRQCRAADRLVHAGLVGDALHPAIAALVDRLKAQGRLTGKQMVVAVMRKLLVICFGVLKSEEVRPGRSP